MNANELADGILAIEERIFLTKKEHQLFQNSAAMLRQQQAEIEALKAEIVSIEKNTDYWADKANWIKPNKPVAYVSTTGLNDIEWTDASHSLNYGDALYTHPIKEHFEDEPQAEELHEIMQSNAELTDEEIIEIGLLTTDPRFSHIESPLLLEFARAILRKAQKE